MSTITTTFSNEFGPDAVPSQSVKEFFNGRSIFITGGSGFLGKMIVEKLLRSCSSVDTIYLLLRPKKGKDPHSRLKLITDNGLYDRLKQENSSALSKLRVVPGDVTQKGLGLSDEDRQTLEENVSVVFHAAASIRFDDPLRDAIIMNVRGTLEVVKLASCMKQLKAMVHISTTYCNLDQKVLPERVLSPHGNWRTFIEVAETSDSMTLNIITKKILSFYPNTYTFTKSLGEQVINDYRDTLPLTIVRPSVVIGTLCDPVPGWLDNMNGPLAIHVAVGKGVLRVICLNPDTALSYVPVDIVNKAIILAAWRRAFQGSLPELPVYNATGHSSYVLNYAEDLQIGVSALRQHPLNGAVYWPDLYITKHFWWYYIFFICTHIPQALLLDTALRLAGKKSMLMKIERKIFIVILALQRFLQVQWTFINDRFLGLEKLLHSEEEEEEFGYHHSRVIEYTYYVNSVIGLNKYIFKEKVDIKKNKKHLERLFKIHCIICALGVAVLGWTLYMFPLHIMICTKLTNAIRFVIQV